MRMFCSVSFSPFPHFPSILADRVCGYEVDQPVGTGYSYVSSNNYVHELAVVSCACSLAGLCVGLLMDRSSRRRIML